MSNLRDENQFKDQRPGDLTPAERDWEAVLSALRPGGVGGPVDQAFRDQVMFRAGEAAGRAAVASSAQPSAPRSVSPRQLRAWRVAAAALLAVSVGLAIRVAVQDRALAEKVRVVHVPAPGSPAGPKTPAGAGQDASPSPLPREPRVAPTWTSETSGQQDWPEPDLGGPAPGSPLAKLVGLAGPAPDYLRVREAVLRWGIRALPAAPAGPGSAAEPPSPRAWAVAPTAGPTDPSPAQPAASPRGDGMRRLKQWLFPGAPIVPGTPEDNKTEGGQS